VRSQNRRFATAAVLTTLLAMSAAHAQVADGGASSDAGAAPTALDAAALVAEVGAPAPVTKAPAPPPTVDQIATMMLATAPPIEAEPPRPITRRLWFWLAVTGAVVAGVLVGVAVHNPNHTRPDCPPDYVCPP
jgi:hypothetical protein